MNNNKIVYVFVSGFFVAMGVATKTNIWATTLAIFLTLLVKSIKEKSFLETLIAVVFLLGVSIVTLLNPLSQYLVNLQKYGTPVTLNVVKEPFPAFFEKTYIRRPGILSIQDGIFTFKFIDLLRISTPHPRCDWLSGSPHIFVDRCVCQRKFFTFL